MKKQGCGRKGIFILNRWEEIGCINSIASGKKKNESIRAVSWWSVSQVV